MKVEFVNYGIANRFKERIELNRELIWYPKLAHYCLKHELDHTNKLFSKEDIANDIQIYPKGLFLFMLTHPKSWTQLSPAIKSKGKWYWDLNLLLTYSVGLIILLTILWLL